ncbi:MAG: hypothetical protein IKO55_18080 [Kiritimatiellae bacterium]|nr:hypothetical protein [Kiritimatiellia bacterium]
MAQTILQSDLSVTVSEFVDGVYGEIFGVCALRQTKFLLGGIVERGTTLVSALRSWTGTCSGPAGTSTRNWP